MIFFISFVITAILPGDYVFLVACMQLYKSLCRLVHRSIGQSIGPSVHQLVGPSHMYVTHVLCEQFLHHCSRPITRD